MSQERDDEARLRALFASKLEDGSFRLEKQSPGGEEKARDEFVLLHPWGDNTLYIAIPEDDEEASRLAELLSKVDLPPKYSAIFHVGAGQLEVLWTALPLRPKHEELRARSFDVWWHGEKRRCCFGPASAEALLLTKYTYPYAAPSHTEHRNTMTFNLLANHGHNSSSLFTDEPVCFWLDCNGLSGEDLDDFVQTINVYMSYYDRESPRVMIHETEFTESPSSRPRYVEGAFPEEIVLVEIDRSVASFWSGAFEARDASMKYLLYFRLLEYLASAHLKKDRHLELEAILRRPHLISSTGSAAAEITTLFSTAPNETDRMRDFLEEAVHPQKVWDVLERNRELFCDVTEFDGGFSLRGVLNGTTTFENWKSNGVRGLVEKLRGLRNCLAHGKDEGTRGVFHANHANRVKLAPWVNLIETIAGEAMLWSGRVSRGDATSWARRAE